MEVRSSTVINNNYIRLDLVNNTDRALVTSVVIILVITLTVDTVLCSDHHRAGLPPYNMTDFMSYFNMSLWFSHHDNFPHSTSMVMMTLICIA